MNAISDFTAVEFNALRVKYVASMALHWDCAVAGGTLIPLSASVKRAIMETELPALNAKCVIRTPSFSRLVLGVVYWMP